jgi:hypothetical protein
MRRVPYAGIAAVLVAALFVPPVGADEVARPPNDDLAQARPIAYPLTTTPVEVWVDNSAATAEAGEPHPCGGSARSVWYSITVPSSGSFAGSVLVEDNGTPLGNLRVAAGRLQGGVFTVLGCGGGSWGTAQLSPGSTTYVQAMDDGTGGGDLRLRFSFLPFPANDTPAGAQAINEFPADASVDNRAATRQSWWPAGAWEPLPCGASSRTVWYRLVVPGDGRVTVTPDLGLLADPVLQAYSWSGNYPPAAIPGACSAGGPLAFDVQRGATYYVQAADVAQADITGGDVTLETRGGTTSLRFEFEAAPDTTPPVVVFGDHPATYEVSDTVAITCTATDDVAVVETTCADVSEPAWWFGTGAHTLTASATDAAGHTASATTTFTVWVSYPSLKALTSQWVSKSQIAAQLNAYLDAAFKAEARGNLKAEAGNLADYRSLLAAQAGKSISPSDADMLRLFSLGL